MNAIETLRAALPTLSAKSQSFAQSLLDQHDMRGSLSEKQMYWVNKLAAEAADRKAPRETAKIDLTKIVDLFDTAGQHLKHPAIVLDGIRLSVAGERAKFPGSINVTSPGSFQDRTWFGRIALDGTFVGSREATPAIVEELKALAADPAGKAALYGKQTGCCCFCARELTDERSIAVGYGPICADHYGLPWGGLTAPRLPFTTSLPTGETPHARPRRSPRPAALPPPRSHVGGEEGAPLPRRCRRLRHAGSGG